jgi:uncharacterized membrane protein YhiD involved in acid resistance
MGLSNWEITLRLVLAALYGGLIGMERHQNGKPVGRRTHAIICVSGAMIAIIGLCGFENLDYFTRDPTRLPVGVLTGLGFVGAGVIWQDKGGVKGLTTAATVYATACIGLTVGFGYYYLSTLGTILIFLILCSGHIIGKIDKHKKIENLENNMRANSKDEMKRQAYYDQIKSEQNIKNQDTDEEEYKKNINEETNNIQKQPKESTNNNLNNT